MSVYQKIINTLVAFGFALITFYILTVGDEIRSLENRISTIEKKQCKNTIEVVKTIEKMTGFPHINDGVSAVMVMNLEPEKKTYHRHEYENMNTDYEAEFRDGFVAKFDIPSDTRVVGIEWEALVCNKTYSINLDVDSYRNDK